MCMKISKPASNMKDSRVFARLLQKINRSVLDNQEQNRFSFIATKEARKVRREEIYKKRLIYV